MELLYHKKAKYSLLKVKELVSQFCSESTKVKKYIKVFDVLHIHNYMHVFLLYFVLRLWGIKVTLTGVYKMPLALAFQVEIG